MNIITKLISFMVLTILISSTSAVAAVRPGTLVLQSSYDTGQVLSSWYQQKSVSTGISVATAPWNSAQKAIKFVINKGESWNGSGTPRSEILQPAFRFSLDKQYHLYSGFYFPVGSNAGSQNLRTVFSFHSDHGVPLIAFTPNNGRINIVTNNISGERWTNVGSMIYGRYVPLEMIFRPSKTAGYIAVIINGTKVYEQNGGSTVSSSDTNGGYVKHGLYDYLNQVPGSLTLFMGKTQIYQE
jgi:hypothetical protein